MGNDRVGTSTHTHFIREMLSLASLTHTLLQIHMLALNCLNLKLVRYPFGVNHSAVSAHSSFLLSLPGAPTLTDPELVERSKGCVDSSHILSLM